MKKLDIFSRFENSLYWVWMVLSIFVFPAILIHLINKLYLESLDWFNKYPILFICWIVGFLICFAIGMAIGSTLEDIFNKIRKILGKKPLMKIINDQKQEQFEQEIQAEERIKGRFLNQSGDEKLYWLWARQNMYFEALTREIRNLKLLIFVLFIPNFARVFEKRYQYCHCERQRSNLLVRGLLRRLAPRNDILRALRNSGL